MTTKNFGAGVSAYLDVDGRSFETTVYQASKPVLDSELNQVQDVNQARNRSLFQLAQSGWLSQDILDTSSHSSGIFIASGTANELAMPPMKALVNGWPIVVDNTNGATNNAISLGAPPASGLRTDLVILEVWRRLLSASPSTDGKSQTARIWRNGNVKIASGNDLALNFADDILDANVAAETTKRVQIQYRLRVIQGVDLDGYPSGIADPSVFAFSVPASAAAPDGTVSAFAYANQSGAGDGGLWRAGNGVPTNSLGTVDGYMYALPLCAVFRRNTTAFARDTNHNGGSGRPDALTATIINARDVFDLRANVSFGGWDYCELLQKNVNLVLDNTLRTEQGGTPFPGASKGHTVLWADEIGPIDNAGAAHLGIPGSVFDGVRRRFSDRVVLETVVCRYVPTDQDGGGASWAPGSVLTIDPTALPIYPHASANYIAAAPSNVAILDVINWVGVGLGSGTSFIGSFDDSTGPTGLRKTPAADEFDSISGLGSTGSVVLTFSSSGFNVPGPSQDLYVTLLISYPGGSDATAGGLTKTPTADYGASSFVIENQVTNLPAAAPFLFNSIVAGIDQPHREALITYKTLTHTFSQGSHGAGGVFALPADTDLLYCPERVASTPTPAITDVTTGEVYTGAVTISEDGHLLLISTLAAAWNGVAPSPADQMDISFQSVRAIPNNSVQCTIYYETRAPQTIRTALLGTTLTVIPRYVAPYLYTIVTGSGSLDEGYPFPHQYVQTSGVYDSSSPTYSGDHELDGLGLITVSDFNADTGFLQIPALVPAVPDPQSLTFTRVGGDVDVEGRSYFKEVPAGYLPSAFGQPLSDPKRHKNVLPMIAELATDGDVGPKGTLLLVMLSRWARFDSDNFVGFDSTLAQNFTSASVYRLKGNPLSPRRA